MERHSVQLLLKGNLARYLGNVSLPLYQIKALERLVQCRTASLGGHAQFCEEGHLNGIWYNSCKHRSCPQCRHLSKEEWIRNTQRVLLDCPHHHVVFTIPSELNTLWRYNREYLAKLLFDSVRETLKVFSADPRYLNATPGILSALHTWGRDLSLHPHLHVLISHGGLTRDGDWVLPRKKHLFPQKPVMMVFRGKLLAMLKYGLSRGELKLPPDHRMSRVEAMFNFLGRKSWVVHFSDRYDHARGVATYLGRYVKGGPFRNSQLKYIGHNVVRFQYKSHKTKRIERMELSVDAFIDRMLQHVPVPCKPSMRYGGLYVSSNRERLNAARQALGQRPVSERERLLWEAFMELKQCKPLCEKCGSPLKHVGRVSRKKIV